MTLTCQQTIGPDKFKSYLEQAKTNSYRGSHGNSTYSTKQARNAKWNNCGSRLACIHNDRTIRIWQNNKPDQKASTEIRQAQSKMIEDISWNPLNSDVFVSVSTDGGVKVWDARTKALLNETNLTTANNSGAIPPVETTGAILCCRYSKEGTLIAVSTQDDHLLIIDGQTLQIEAFYRDLEEIYDLDWSNNSRYVALSLGNGNVRLIELDLDAPIANRLVARQVLSGPRTAATCVQFDPRGQVLAVGSNDGIVSLWSLTNWICTLTFSKVDEQVNSISFSHDGEYLAIGYDQDTSIDVVSTATGEYIFQVPRSHAFTSRPTVCWHPLRYQLLFTGDSNGVSVIHQQ